MPGSENKIKTMLSIVHDHNYAVSLWNNTTIDDNITTTLSTDQMFGVLLYENDTDEVILKWIEPGVKIQHFPHFLFVSMYFET